MAVAPILQRTMQAFSPWSRRLLHAQAASAPSATLHDEPIRAAANRHEHFAERIAQRHPGERIVNAAQAVQPSRVAQRAQPVLPLAGDNAQMGVTPGAQMRTPAVEETFTQPLETWMSEAESEQPTLVEPAADAPPTGSPSFVAQLGERIQPAQAQHQSAASPISSASAVSKAQPEHASSAQSSQPSATSLVALIEERIQRAQQGLPPIPDEDDKAETAPFGAPTPAILQTEPEARPPAETVATRATVPASQRQQQARSHSLVAMIEERIQRAEQGLPPIPPTEDEAVGQDTPAAAPRAVQTKAAIEFQTATAAAGEQQPTSSSVGTNVATSNLSASESETRQDTQRQPSLTALIEERIQAAAQEQKPPVAGQPANLPPQVRRLLAYSTVEEIGTKQAPPPRQAQRSATSAAQSTVQAQPVVTSEQSEVRVPPATVAPTTFADETALAQSTQTSDQHTPSNRLPETIASVQTKSASAAAQQITTLVKQDEMATVDKGENLPTKPSDRDAQATEHSTSLAIDDAANVTVADQPMATEAFAKPQAAANTSVHDDAPKRSTTGEQADNKQAKTGLETPFTASRSDLPIAPTLAPKTADAPSVTYQAAAVQTETKQPLRTPEDQSQAHSSAAQTNQLATLEASAPQEAQETSGQATPETASSSLIQRQAEDEIRESPEKSTVPEGVAPNAPGATPENISARLVAEGHAVAASEKPAEAQVNRSPNEDITQSLSIAENTPDQARPTGGEMMALPNRPAADSATTHQLQVVRQESTMFGNLQRSPEVRSRYGAATPLVLATPRVRRQAQPQQTPTATGESKLSAREIGQRTASEATASSSALATTELQRWFAPVQARQSEQAGQSGFTPERDPQFADPLVQRFSLPPALPAMDQLGRLAGMAQPNFIPGLPDLAKAKNLPQVIGMGLQAAAKLQNKGNPAKPNLDQLAHQILPIIKRLLAVERERGPYR